METRITLADEKETELAARGQAIIADAATFVMIKDDAHRNMALAFSLRLKRMRQIVSDLFDDPIDRAYKLHRSLCNRRNVLDSPLADADRTIKNGIGTYEANKRAEIEARRRAEEAEARRKAEEAEGTRQREIAAIRKAAEDTRLADAAALEAAGKSKEAEALIAAPVHVVIPPVAPPAPVFRTPAYKAPEAVATRVNWKARVVNAALIPREWLIPNEMAIGAYARAQKDKAVIPGVEFYAEASASLR